MLKLTVSRRKKVLAAVVAAAGAIGLAAPCLRAAPEFSPMTAEQASQKFMLLLEILRSPQMQMSYFGRDTEREVAGFINTISAQNRKDLGERGMGELVSALALQAHSPGWQAKVETATGDGKTAVATVMPETAPQARSLVLVREGDTWRVDIIETYARWNDLKEGDKQQRIYDMTHVILPGMPENENMRRAACQSQMKQIALGFIQYTQDYDERYPSAREWSSAIIPYIKGRELYKCPSVQGAPWGYGMNMKLSRKSLAAVDFPAETNMNYESRVLKANVFGEGNDLAYRHTMHDEAGANHAYVDGHVKWVAQGGKVRFNLGSGSGVTNGRRVPPPPGMSAPPSARGY